MATKAKDIIAGVEENYPVKEQHVKIKNCSDLNIDTQIKLLNQYIIGIAHSDPLDNDIRHYESHMKQKLENVTPYVRCLPWSFYDYELEEVKSILKELSEYFQANLDIEKLIRNLNIRKEDGKMYFIVITVVQYPVIYIE